MGTIPDHLGILLDYLETLINHLTTLFDDFEDLFDLLGTPLYQYQPFWYPFVLFGDTT